MGTRKRGEARASLSLANSATQCTMNGWASLGCPVQNSQREDHANCRVSGSQGERELGLEPSLWSRAVVLLWRD